MSRYSNQNSSSGVSMTGPVYEPQVSPYDREEDDVSVLQNRGPYRDDYDDAAYGRNDFAGKGKTAKSGRARKPEGDIWNAGGLTPGYEEPAPAGRRKSERKAQPWDNYKDRRGATDAAYGELADAYRQQGQYRQPWDDYLTKKR